MTFIRSFFNERRPLSRSRQLLSCSPTFPARHIFLQREEVSHPHDYGPQQAFEVVRQWRYPLLNEVSARSCKTIAERPVRLLPASGGIIKLLSQSIKLSPPMGIDSLSFSWPTIAQSGNENPQLKCLLGVFKEISFLDISMIFHSPTRLDCRKGMWTVRFNIICYHTINPFLKHENFQGSRSGRRVPCNWGTSRWTDRAAPWF